MNLRTGGLSQGYGEAAMAGMSIISQLLKKNPQGGGSGGGGMDGQVMTQSQTQSVTQAQSNNQSVIIGSNVGGPSPLDSVSGGVLNPLGILGNPNSFQIPTPAVSVGAGSSSSVNYTKWILIAGAAVAILLVIKKRRAGRVHTLAHRY